MKQEFNMEVINCARCQKNHKDIHFRLLHNAVITESLIFNYFGICPTFEEPILMRITNDYSDITE